MAVLIVGLAYGLPWVVPTLTGTPFLTFFPAVHIVAMLCGMVPGVLAAVTSGILATAFLPPYLLDAGTAGFVKLLTFYLACIPSLATMGVVEKYYRSLQQANALSKSLLADKEKLIGEREVLIQEIHHRVKNNMQAIVSLMQVEKMRGQSGRDETVRRIEAMSLVHEALYRGDNCSSVSTLEYLESLFKHISDTDSGFSFEIMGDDAEIGMDQGIALAMLVNELVLNVLKHGRGADGKARVMLDARQLDGDYRIIISDRGPGWPDGFDGRTKGTLGMSLVQRLAQQLGGKLAYWNENGARLSLTFPIGRRVEAA